MSDIFLSYSSRNREPARRLAEALGAQGWSVWWDHEIQTGQVYHQVIEQALHAARAVVVLWTVDSVGSEWVKNEAAVAAERGVLLPVNLDGTRLPLEFRARQTADLRGWDGDVSQAGFQALCRGVSRLLQQANGPDALAALVSQKSQASPTAQGADGSGGASGAPSTDTTPSPGAAPRPSALAKPGLRLAIQAALAVAVLAMAGVAVLSVSGTGSGVPDRPVPAAGGAAAPPATTSGSAYAPTPSAAEGLADTVVGTYVGDIVADSQGSSRSGVEVTVTRLDSNKVRLASANPRIGTTDLELERVGDNIACVDAGHVLLVDLRSRPLTMQWNPRLELSYSGRRLP